MKSIIVPTMPVEQRRSIPTIIESTTDVRTIEAGVLAYENSLLGLFPVVLPPEYKDVDLKVLQTNFKERLSTARPLVVDIIKEINQRSRDGESPRYKELKRKDRACWDPGGHSELVFGFCGCVDRGIPQEAIAGLDGLIARTLGGDWPLYHSKASKSFHLEPTPVTKSLIHAGHQGRTHLLEVLIEHTGCGRRAQVIGNDAGSEHIPSVSFIFEHAQSLATLFPDNPTASEKLANLKHYWESLPRSGSGVEAPDKGILAGIVSKLAQRQALQAPEIASVSQIVAPIGLWDKMNANYLCGLDRLDVLADPEVLENGGFTPQMLEKLIDQKKIFSLQHESKDVFDAIEKQTQIAPGDLEYKDIQNHWVIAQGKLVETTASLWEMVRANNPVIESYVTNFITAQLATIPQKDYTPDMIARLTHQLFHMTAYAYRLNTFEKGNEPGHHIEDHLATGDHDNGAKSHLALSQGDMAPASSAEMFTGYNVLLHSTPGEAGLPIVAMIKLDTERPGSMAMTTEETTVALDGFRTMLELWPYILVGDIAPIIAIRDKQVGGGVSRLARSVVQAFGNLSNLFDSSTDPLPEFVPAATKEGEVVMVPALDVLEKGVEAGSDLKHFRKLMQEVASYYSKRPALQTKLSE